MEKYRIDLSVDGKKYIQIYNHIKSMIENQVIKGNEKLPPIRKLSKILEVNNTTIVKVYEILEKDGYIYKVVGSGTFASKINMEKNNEQLTNKDIINLDYGNPSSDIFPIKDFKKSINIALDKEGSNIFEYYDALGSKKLREEIKKYLLDKNIDTSIDNIQIISGAQQGIDIVCKAIVNYSDIIFVEEPTYSGAIDIFKSRGAKVISIPMLDDGIDIGVLKMKLKKIKPKIFYTMPNFQNPTGISYSSYKKKKLIELAEEFDFYIIEDDFMSDFRFQSDDNSTLRSYDDKNRVIYIKSFSKILMPGLRIGIIEMPNEVLKRVSLAKRFTDISTSALIQNAMYYYMKEFSLDNHLKNIEEIYTDKFNISKKIIDEELSKYLKIRNASGGINFFLELPRGYKSEDFVAFMNKKGVSLLPGYSFYENLLEDRFFRINIANATIEEIKKGICIISNNLEEYLKEYKRT